MSQPRTPRPHPDECYCGGCNPFHKTPLTAPPPHFTNKYHLRRTLEPCSTGTDHSKFFEFNPFQACRRQRYFCEQAFVVRVDYCRGVVLSRQYHHGCQSRRMRAQGLRRFPPWRPPTMHIHLHRGPRRRASGIASWILIPSRSNSKEL